MPRSSAQIDDRQCQAYFTVHKVIDHKHTLKLQSVSALSACLLASGNLFCRPLYPVEHFEVTEIIKPTCRRRSPYNYM